MNRLLVFFFVFFLLSLGATFAQHSHRHTTAKLGFVINKGQFNDKVLFRTGIGGMNKLFLEKNTLTYLFFDEEASSAIHDLRLENPDALQYHKVPAHSYKVHFKGALEPRVTGKQARSYHQNYFLGKDPSKWASKVSVYDKVVHEELYSNINMESYSEEGHYKYDFIIKKGGNPSDIILEYEGADKIYIQNNFLFIKTSVGTSRESQPYSYQIINGQKKEIACEYQLKGNNQVVFYFPDGYNKDYDLVIDPVLVGATLSGTIGSENFGHTATYDAEGNIYSGGISFGVGYPTTTGAFDDVYHGGTTFEVDMVFSKYNPNGSNLLYATYVGGAGDDFPHSTIVDANGQLCILGSTNSQDFPILSNSYQQNNGGAVDITVTKLNADGTDLVGVTYLGGNNQDGINLSELNVSYGEAYRGEIISDDNGNIYIASTSSSHNFPTTNNAFQEQRGGLQDGVVFKLNSDLSTLYWSSFIGGTGNDTAAGIRIKDDGTAIVVGTAGSSNFPMGQDGLYPNWLGGEENAYIMIFSPNGQNVIQSTYWGTDNGKEHAYFVDIDEENNIHVYGTTTSANLLVTPNTFSTNNGSPQYIAAFSPNLSSLVYSTTIGLGAYGTAYDFVPSAFMVDKCNSIYFSGYYANHGLPTTNDAFFSQADPKKSFYLGVLEPEATALSFGTYYGKANHVDGGTSRFDKAGIVYQGVCSCKGPNRVLNTTAGAWAEFQEERCDVGVFKIDFERSTVTAAAVANPQTSGCVPFHVDLNYTGQGAEVFEWSIDGEVISTQENTSHLFDKAGSYTVMLAVSTQSSCNVYDTTYLHIDALSQNSRKDTVHFCAGQESIFLDATIVNANYTWQNGYTGATYTANEEGLYWVDVAIPGCSRRDTFIVEEAVPFQLNIGNDTTFCDVDSAPLDASHPSAIAYEWSNTFITPEILITAPGTYAVTVTDVNNCVVEHTVHVDFQTTPVFSFSDTTVCEGDTVILSTDWDANYLWSDGSSNQQLLITEEGMYALTLTNGGCSHIDSMMFLIDENPITWEVDSISCSYNCDGRVAATIAPNVAPSSLNLEWNIPTNDLVLSDLCEGLYALTITDNNTNCQFVETANLVAPDTLLFETEYKHITCFGDKDGYIIVKNIRGGTLPYQYFFDGNETVLLDSIKNLSRGAYDVWVKDANGCEYRADGIFIDEPFFNLVEAGEDKKIELGDSVKLDGYVLSPTNQYSVWETAEGLWCRECIQTVVSPLQTTTYTLATLDTITGCRLADDVTVFIEKPRAVFIPNVFSPNGDGKNDLFTIYANQGVEQINWLRIYDRWGELVFENEKFKPNQPKFGWNGVFKGKKMNPAVFVYYAEVVFKDGKIKRYVGDVTLIE